MTRQTLRLLSVAALLVVAMAAGVGGVAAVETGAVHQQSGNQTAADSVGPETRQAQVAVDVPDYVDEPRTIAGNGSQTIVVEHTGAELAPQNFGADNVIGYGVESGAGDLSYEDQFGTFEYDSGGVVGTTTLYWEVEEEVRVGNETREVRTRYTTRIRTTSNTTYEHYSQGEISEMRSDAANWSEWERTMFSIWGSDANINDKTQIAAELSKLRANPLSALTGQFSGLLLSLFITLGGLLILGLFGAFHLVSRFSDMKYINRNESLKADEKALDDKHAELDWREKMRSVARWDWTDFFGDLTARSYQSIGETSYKGMKRLQAVRRPRNIIEHRVQAMAQDGYVGVVERDDVATDGGDGDADAGPIVDAQVVRRDDVADGDETVELDDYPSEFIDALDWDSQTIRSYDLSNSDATPADIHVEQAPVTLEELTDDLGADLRQFDSREEWGQYLLEFITYVRGHEFCDSEGRPDDIQFILNEWLDADDMLSDGFDIPHFGYEAEAIEWAVKHSDPVEEAERTIDDIQRGVDPDA